jgi:hypothetical protein
MAQMQRPPEGGLADELKAWRGTTRRAFFMADAISAA